MNLSTTLFLPTTPEQRLSMKLNCAKLVRATCTLALMAGMVLTAATKSHAQFGGFQRLDPFNKNSDVNRWGVRPNDIPPFKPLPPPSMSHLSGLGGVAGFRTGAVVVNNDYGGDVQIRLYHPQNRGVVFSSSGFRGSERSNLSDNNNQQVVVGSDWGIQVVFGNGVASPIRIIGNISGHDGRTFSVNASQVFGG